jgi:hypothetical protein
MSTPTQLAAGLLQPTRASALLCSDLGVFSFTETPLPAVGRNELVQDLVLVNVNVLRAYEQMISELERQVYRYRKIFERFGPRPETDAEAARLSASLNAASTALVDSITHTRIREDSVLRAFDDEES